MSNNPPAPPTPTTRKFAKLFVGFGVGFVVGVAPYLGIVHVPGFTALLSLYPVAIRGQMIGFSSALMGILATVVQFVAGENTTRDWLLRAFKRTGITAVILLVALLAVHVTFVTSVPLAGNQSQAFVTGFTRQPSCGCPPAASNAQCILGLSLDEAAIAGCWGDNQIHLAEILIFLTYLGLTGCFGALVGLEVIRQDTKRSP